MTYDVDAGVPGPGSPAPGRGRATPGRGSPAPGRGGRGGRGGPSPGRFGPPPGAGSGRRVHPGPPRADEVLELDSASDVEHEKSVSRHEYLRSRLATMDKASRASSKDHRRQGGPRVDGGDPLDGLDLVPGNSKELWRDIVDRTGPREVRLWFVVKAVRNMTESGGSVDIDFNLYLQWEDPCMVGAKSNGFQGTAEEYAQLWHPNLEINNSIEHRECWDMDTSWSLEDDATGLMQYCQRYVGTLSNFQVREGAGGCAGGACGGGGSLTPKNSASAGFPPVPSRPGRCNHQHRPKVLQHTVGYDPGRGGEVLDG